MSGGPGSISGGNRRAGGTPDGSRIHQGLVGDRALIGTPYMADPALRLEYAREIAPRTLAALAKVLAEVFPPLPNRPSPRRVLDLGAGTGAAGAAVGQYFRGDIDLVSVDRVRPPQPVTAGGALTADATDRAAMARLTASGGRFDLVVAAHVLNELFVGEAAPSRLAHLGALVRHWAETLLCDGGTLIVIEPALRETSRALLAVRDHLLAAGLHVVAPCFFTGPCPALMRDRDWCHDAAPAPPTAAGAGPRARAHARVDFSYLVMRGAGDPESDPALFRIVSDPLPEKGRLKLFACGPSGRHPVVRLDRHATSSNTDLARLVRGDIARITHTTFAQDGLRVVSESTVARRGGGA